MNDDDDYEEWCREKLKMNYLDLTQRTTFEGKSYKKAHKAYMARPASQKSPDAKDDDGWTALHYAVMNEDVPLIKALLDQNKSMLDEKNISSMSALAYAAYTKRPAALRALLNHKNTVHDITQVKTTFCDLLEEAKHKKIAALAVLGYFEEKRETLTLALFHFHPNKDDYEWLFYWALKQNTHSEWATLKGLFKKWHKQEMFLHGTLYTYAMQTDVLNAEDLKAVLKYRNMKDVTFEYENIVRALEAAPDAATANTIKAVTAGWKPKTHHAWHNAKTQEAVQTVLTVQYALDRDDTGVNLPEELYLHILSFVMPNWWPAHA